MELVRTIFDVANAAKQLTELEAKTSDPNFWNDQEKAQALLQRRKQVEDRVNASKLSTRKSATSKPTSNSPRKNRTMRSAIRFSRTSPRNLTLRTNLSPSSKPRLFSPARTIA